MNKRKKQASVWQCVWLYPDHMEALNFEQAAERLNSSHFRVISEVFLEYESNWGHTYRASVRGEGISITGKSDTGGKIGMRRSKTRKRFIAWDMTVLSNA